MKDFIFILYMRFVKTRNIRYVEKIKDDHVFWYNWNGISNFKYINDNFFIGNDIFKKHMFGAI